MKREKEILEIENIVKKTGFLSLNEGIALYNLAKNGPGKGVIVEIGSFKGKSTIWLGRGSKSVDGGTVYSIDPHNLTGRLSTTKGSITGGVYIPQNNTYKSFLANVRRAEIEETVTAIVNFSYKVARKWNKPIRLLFIDGSHDYPNVKRDFLLWEPFVSLNGIIAFHDSEGRLSKFSPGVKKFIQKKIIHSKRFNISSIIDSTTFIKKNEKINFYESLKNKIFIKFIPLEITCYNIYGGFKNFIKKTEKNIKNIIIPKLKFNLYKFFSNLKRMLIYLINLPERFLGKFGIFLKKHNIELYNKLKNIEKKIRK